MRKNNSQKKDNKENKPKNFKATVKRLLTYIKKYRLVFAVIVIFTILGTIPIIFTPKILGNATTSIYNSVMNKAPVDFVEIKKILFYLVIINIFSATFTYLGLSLISTYSQKIIFDIRKDINDKLSRLPLKYYDTTSVGDFMSRVTNDIDNISGALRDGIFTFISAFVLIISMVILMFYINVYMALIIIISLPLSAFASKSVISKSQKYFKQKQKVLGELNGHVEESLSALITVKSFNKEEDVLSEFEEFNNSLKHKGLMANFLSSLMMPLMTLISNFTYVVVSIVGAILLMNGQISIGNIQAFLVYTRRFGMPIAQIASIASFLQSTVAAAERVFELLDAEELDLSFENSLPENAKGNIKFEHVKFGYSSDKTLMEDVNLEVKSGETIAIIGPTGAGKTTLVNLLMRFYDVASGKITVDGIDIKELDRPQLRRQFGMVLQDTWLFKGTIYENIAYSRQDATREEVIQAAKIAKAHHFIKTQADGYDTIINEEGSNISAGQKQLITIARAVLAEPNILILDEATSSVDTRTEVLIKKGLDNLSKNKTTFMIAHRLSTIRNADRVMLMEKGDIIKVGTYAEVVGD